MANRARSVPNLPKHKAGGERAVVVLRKYTHPGDNARRTSSVARKKQIYVHIYIYTFYICTSVSMDLSIYKGVCVEVHSIKKLS